MRIYLDLKRNAYHTLYHAIEHLQSCDEAEREEPGDVSNDAREWDSELGTVGGNNWFYLPGIYTKPPVEYGYKFALLHLIQAVELLMKSHLNEKIPGSIFPKPTSRFSIDMKESVRRICGEYPNLLSPSQVALLLQAKVLRNAVEHFEFDFPKQEIRQVCLDLLAIATLFAAHFDEFSLAREFSFDPWKDGADPVGLYLSGLISSLTPVGVEALVTCAERWNRLSPDDEKLLCLQCGTRGASKAEGICLVCGADVDEEISRCVDDLQQIVMELQVLKNAKKKH